MRTALLIPATVTLGLLVFGLLAAASMPHTGCILAVLVAVVVGRDVARMAG